MVEDDADVRTYVTETLAGLGYDVLDAGSGDDALRVMDQHQAIALLLTDVVMPGMNGRKLAEAARAIARISDEAGAMRLLRETTATRIAGGEMARDFDHLRRALDADALDVFQPDVVLALGISGTRTLADLVLRRNRWFTPHTWTNGIGLLANLHVCAGVGGGPYLEYPYDPPGWTPERRDFMLAEPVAVDADGMVRVPDAPGLGVALDEDAVSFYAGAVAT